jgi:GNAT superfamily N-acetyltransferase
MAAYRWANIQKTAHKRDYQVAEVGGQVIGLVGIMRFPAAHGVVRTAKLFRLPTSYIDEHRPAAAEVLDLVVADGFRGKKIGSMLTLAALVGKLEEGITYFHAYAPAYAAPLLAGGGFAKTSDEVGSIRWGRVASFFASLNEASKPRLFDAMEALIQPRGLPGLHS